MEYLDFGIPISFGYTAQYLPQKSCTRRDWKDSHASKFIQAFERAEAAGKKLRVPALSKSYPYDGPGDNDDFGPYYGDEYDRINDHSEEPKT